MRITSSVGGVETELDTGWVFGQNITAGSGFKRISILTLNKIAIIGINMRVECTNGANTEDCSVPAPAPSSLNSTAQGNFYCVDK